MEFDRFLVQAEREVPLEIKSYSGALLDIRHEEKSVVRAGGRELGRDFGELSW